MAGDTNAHEQPPEPDRPSFVLDRAVYPRVERAHIVPRMYQKAFAVNGMVAVHLDGSRECVIKSTRVAGTRPAYYRRDRPDGQPIDDVEASLSAIEDKAAQPLRELISGEPITVERKGILAQFLAVQMLRGPAFFKQREQLLAPMIKALEAEHFTAEGMAAAGGDVDLARKHAMDKHMAATPTLLSMLTRSQKLASLLGIMRWSTVCFDQCALGYSDHPVVMWPMDTTRMQAPASQQFGALSALELRVPLAPTVALFMDWVDRTDQDGIPLNPPAAAEINAFTAAQAEREWMHRPGVEPELATGALEPLCRLIEPAYDRDTALRSARRTRAQYFLEGVKGREFVNVVEVLTDLGPA